MRSIVLAFALLASTTASAEPGCTMTREQFETIKSEWFISRVNNFLGCTGDLITETKLGDYETQIRNYPTAGGGYVRLWFQNRRLIQKHQYGF